MEKVSNQLFLNYSRPNGKAFKATIQNGTRSIPTGSVHVFPEVLVPGASSAEHDMLTALANSLYLEARSHNMSLAPYGHLDPVKIAIAGTFVGVLMTDAIGDLSVIGKYSFSNINMGRALAAARNIQLVSTEEDFSNLCKRFNILVAKVNSLYIPVTGFARRWYEHRRNIYKDDEGDRFSLYTYYLQNYYEYIVDPTDTNAGRLVCRFRSHGFADGSEESEATTFVEKLQVIEQLVDNYLNDDDVANFCTEALHAGMPHMSFAPLKSVTHENKDGDKVQQFVGPELKLVYDLDDILGLENACFVKPTAIDYVPSGDPEFLNWATWDIYEDVTRNRLICGSVSRNVNQLPGFSKSASAVDNGSQNWNIGERPIFTHAKVTSLPGLTSLTRYIVSTGGKMTKNLGVTDPESVNTWYNGVIENSYQFSGISVTPIQTHGTELLAGHFIVRQGESGLVTKFTSRIMQIVLGDTDAALLNYMLAEANLNVGLKARFVTYYYSVATLKFEPGIADFDYVTSVSDDALATFFGANAWNDTMLIDKIDQAETTDK